METGLFHVITSESHDRHGNLNKFLLTFLSGDHHLLEGKHLLLSLLFLFLLFTIGSGEAAQEQPHSHQDNHHHSPRPLHNSLL